VKQRVRTFAAVSRIRTRCLPVLSAALFLLVPLGLAAQRPTAQDSIPHLRRHGDATQLIVDGAPFLILGGEVGNSSGSSLEYMRAIWPKLEALHLNTVLVPVYWDLIEPREGVFGFSLVDGLLRDARRAQRVRLYRYR
jgi:hypothetical protein